MNKELNILFLGGAKRVAMAGLFKAAAARAGLTANIFSYELGPCEPIAAVATVITGLRWRDPEVYSHLHEVCQANHITVMVPFVDAAVAVSAEYARCYRGEVFVPTGAAEIAETMFDKVLAAKIFAANNLPIPATWNGHSVTSPLIAKPRHGSASKGIRMVNGLDDLQALDNLDNYLIQERIDRRREITVDCYASVADGRVLAAVPRLRDEVSGGEVSRTSVRHWPEAQQLAAKVITSCSLRGAVTVQLIHDVDRDRLLVMEVNPRLGGGAVASVRAGADIPAMIIAEATGTTPAPCTDWQDIVMTRYPQDVCFDANGRMLPFNPLTDNE